MIIKEWGSPDAAQKTLVFLISISCKMWHFLPTELKHSCWWAFNCNRRKIIHYLKHWAGQYSWAGVGPEKEADPEQWRCIPPSETDPAPGSVAASGGSAPDQQTSAHMDRTVASVQLNIFCGEVQSNVDRPYLLVPLYLCDQQEFIEQEQVDVNHLCVLWEWTKTNTVRDSITCEQTYKMCSS